MGAVSPRVTRRPPLRNAFFFERPNKTKQKQQTKTAARKKQATTNDKPRPWMKERPPKTDDNAITAREKQQRNDWPINGDKIRGGRHDRTRFEMQPFGLRNQK